MAAYEKQTFGAWPAAADALDNRSTIVLFGEQRADLLTLREGE
jgi:hypothetical protein